MSLVVVANREPLRQEAGTWVPSVGGLATALLPVLERRGGTWVAWGEKDAEALPLLTHPPGAPRFTVRRLALPAREVAGSYHGMANRTLWPLAHYFLERVEVRRSFYEAYRATNQRFAEAVLEAWRDPAAPVWVHDYHLMLVPALLRATRPRGRIGFFWHIPWPPPEVWQVLPWARQLVEGVLGADLVGLHTPEYVENFLATCRLLTGAAVHGRRVRWQGREIRVEAHPIGIDTARFRQWAAEPRVRERAARIRRTAGSRFVLVGVDRLDYTKGIPERLAAWERLLERYPQWRGQVTLYQIAVPSRTRLASYRQLKRQVDEQVGRINGAFMHDGWLPVRYLYRAFPPRDLTAFYLAADAALITPLRDGMNLVAQEYAWVTENGVLILSSLAGAAAVLPEAVAVNPYDVDGLAEAIHGVLASLADERARQVWDARRAALKKRVAALDVHGWAERFLDSLEAMPAALAGAPPG
ncbi:trehalose 6-phosphate synthase [Thermaerobacter marianensis DSM 12885]|uniref:Trehalose 6-phosphate synthase n=1 Tax=Thermaerobacter marianensis (strain ATCC 700841 / DSM 12885 / JCM 10246 / 7p75a) TaxID=644966 RepID=E6SHA5_THEM7|nr:trehalose-6-phosphate synthase [Thermaerobacter marianensis]ADU50669.1 trehalose 6-phosphate synthase [Thermaerobacter marianensis DSM 12885]